ncbi:MAG TPA: zf-HC2 domain-containing protein [Bryobacteraceae bacterium]|jgi:anti-sigma factor RsiW|nr:zf-HC2 domain-containing protein [Bryobacteraceae bacterium]
MHAVIIDDLERYLSGHLRLSALDRFRAHLATCGECRREVDEVKESTGLLASLKPDESVDPPPSFVAQVMQSVALQPARSYWKSLGDFAFGRRVVFASLLTLAVLGTVLVSREESYAPNPTTPEAVMADAAGSSPNANQMLVTLASYEP